MEECVFCQIVNKKIESPVVYEDERFLVIPSKFPSAETHLLVLPKKHIQSIKQAKQEDEKLIGEMLLLGAQIAREKELPDYKLLLNAGKYAQVPHLHLHVLAGNLESIT